MTLTEKVTFHAILQRGNRLQVPKLISGGSNWSQFKFCLLESIWYTSMVTSIHFIVQSVRMGDWLSLRLSGSHCIKKVPERLLVKFLK